MKLLKVDTLVQARERLLKAAKECLPETEQVALADAFDRILAEDIVSGEMIPAFRRSSVDGYAVCSKDTAGRPVIFRRENGDGQSLIIRLVDPQDMLAGVRTQRAIRYGHHHDRKRIPEQAHRRGLAVRERTTQLIGRTLEGNPVRPRTI